MVTIFHISDLHIIRSAYWNNIRECILKEAEEIEGERLLVVTGDYHNFWEGDYAQAESFLRELIEKLNIEASQDVFVVPGNHDVGSSAGMKRFFDPDDDWEYHQENEVNWLQHHKSDEKNYTRHVTERLKVFKPYCEFVKQLGIYPDDVGLLPANVHVRCWRGKLNFLHLNTALIADGKTKTGQKLDILSATSREIWMDKDVSLPTLTLGHNRFCD